MAEFEVPVVRITKVEDHPNADRLSLNYFREYICISNKLEDGSHRYSQGDLMVYVPESAMVPEYLLRQGYWDEEKNKGILAGSHGNRVKAMRIRSIISQGLMFRIINGNYVIDANGSHHYVQEDDDVSTILGITKYEPPIPVQMAGEVINLFGFTLQFDVENYKKYPDIFEEGENVEFSEKLHGTWMGVSVLPIFNPDLWESDTAVYSKGLGAAGLVFKDNEKNIQNVYLRTAKKYNLREKITNYYPGIQVTLLGEVYGKGVQDLQYDTVEPEYALFDIYLGEPGKGVYLDRTRLEIAARDMDIPIVPILYQGGFSKDIMQMYTDGKTTAGKNSHIREGIVIRPMDERRHPKIGRVLLKSVSDAYLFRKGNTTELA